MDEGWGRVEPASATRRRPGLRVPDQSALLTNQAVYEKRVLIGSAAEPLRITLAYTDVPGNRRPSLRWLTILIWKWSLPMVTSMPATSLPTANPCPTCCA